MAKKNLSRAERYKRYCMLYTKISKATAETIGDDNKPIKTTYFGKLSELFEGVDVSTSTLTVFLWAVSHKTNALPTTLFKIDRARFGNTGGISVIRAHSGFYENGKHIVGTDLVPYIMSAMKEYKPEIKYNRKNNTVSEEVVQIEETSSNQEMSSDQLSPHQLSMEIELCTTLTGLAGVGEDALEYFGKDAYARFEKAKSDIEKYEAEVKRRAAVRANQEKLKQVLELMEMSKEDLEDLIASC